MKRLARGEIEIHNRKSNKKHNNPAPSLQLFLDPAL